MDRHNPQGIKENVKYWAALLFLSSLAAIIIAGLAALALVSLLSFVFYGILLIGKATHAMEHLWGLSHTHLISETIWQILQGLWLSMLGMVLSAIVYNFLDTGRVFGVEVWRYE